MTSETPTFYIFDPSQIFPFKHKVEQLVANQLPAAALRWRSLPRGRNSHPKNRNRLFLLSQWTHIILKAMFCWRRLQSNRNLGFGFMIWYSFRAESSEIYSGEIASISCENLGLKMTTKSSQTKNTRDLWGRRLGAWVGESDLEEAQNWWPAAMLACACLPVAPRRAVHATTPTTPNPHPLTHWDIGSIQLRSIQNGSFLQDLSPTIYHLFSIFQGRIIVLHKGQTQEKKLLFFRILSKSCTPFCRHQNSRFESQFRTKNTIYAL